MHSIAKSDAAEQTTGEIIPGRTLDIETTNDLNISGEELELPQGQPQETFLPLWKVAIILLVAVVLIGVTFLIIKANIHEIGPETAEE